MGQDELIKVMEQYTAQLLAKAFSILHHHQDAEDAMQNTYLKAWHCRETIRSEANCLAWLNRIVYHECMDILRKRKRQPLCMPDEQLSSVESWQYDWDYCFEKWLLDEHVRSLPVKLLITFYMYYIHGYEIKEVANKLRIPEGTVKSRLYQARMLLKSMYSPAVAQRNAPPC